MARKDNFELVATAIHEKMKAPTQKQAEAIYRRTFPAGPISRMWRRKPVHYCSECGCEMEYIGQKRCPQCGVRWTAKPEKYDNRRYANRAYHMELEAKGAVQVCRFYLVERHTQFGKKAGWLVMEVERIMYAPNGVRKVFARGCQGLSWYFDAWSYYSPMTIRRDGKYMSEKSVLRYNLDVWTYRIKSLTQQWKYKEIPALLSMYKNDTSVLRVIALPYGETLRKTGQYEFFDYLVNHRKYLPKEVVPALNICTRNHYYIDDPSLWLDHLELLKHFKLDMHNAHYVCPENLREAHQKLYERRRRDQERVEAARREAYRLAEEQRRMERDRLYKEMVENWTAKMGAILGLSINGTNLNIKPLQSIDEFKKEGDAMHHCVYTMGYWDITKHPNTLILSAKDGAGKRLATIEYNTARHNIVQCRAACNAVPERDKEIRALIISHREDFERLMKQKEVSTNGTKKSKQQTAAIAA